MAFAYCVCNVVMRTADSFGLLTVTAGSLPSWQTSVTGSVEIPWGTTMLTTAKKDG
jgi:hypothetical protein